MAIEIERRFLVSGKGWEPFVILMEKYLQGYLISNDENWAVRVRMINQQSSLLTIKTPYTKNANHEFEYSIPIEDAKSLLSLTKYTVSKTRYTIKTDEHEWVVDYFHQSNAPLLIAEIELMNIDQKINIPDWCGNEITGIKSLSNASLAKRPISEWPLEARINSKAH